MPWIDTLKPPRPVLSYDSANSFFQSSIQVNLAPRAEQGIVNKYVLYNFPGFSEMKMSDPKNIAAIISGQENSISFPLSGLPAQQSKVILAVTAVTKNNNESELSRYIYLERSASGWHVTTMPPMNGNN